MTIATYNVNGIRSRLPVLLRWLEKYHPSVVCLQELKAPDDKFPLMDLQAAGYECLWFGQSRWNGVAVLSRMGNPLLLQKGLAGDDSDEQSRYMETRIGEVVIAGLYLPNGNPAPGPKYDYKLRWMERLKDRTARLIKEEGPVIILGDFNVIPTENDVYKPERWTEDALFRVETRQAYEGILKQGWTDAIRYLHPHETIYTFYDYFRQAYERNAGLRIDHFLLNQAALKKLKAGGVHREVRGWEKSSDHVPVWIELA